MTLGVVVLAAGEGKRMHSQVPKVLHKLAGKPILQHVITAAQMLLPQAIFVVYGHKGEQVQQQLKFLPIKWVQQAQQLGTGHAVAQVMPQAKHLSRLLVLVGDIPLITVETLQTLLTQTPANAVGLVTAQMPDPTGLGRILRNSAGDVVGIVEEKDATDEQRAIKEINTGIILAPVAELTRWLPNLSNNNAQGEYYLTDIIAMAVKENKKITTVTAKTSEEVQGINDRSQLAALERYYQKQFAEQLMRLGATLSDPHRFDVRGNLTVGQDVSFDVGVIIEGTVTIGNGSQIGPYVVLRDVQIGENVEIKAHSVIEESYIANDCIIGPFARLRPGTTLAEKAHIGNFVETKKTSVGVGSKISHLSYIGDATIGTEVNIGAGTITCNYDGVNKHPTTIGDRAFIGSATQLVAPVTIGSGATIGAGSTVTRDAPAELLTVTHRLEQRTLASWQRPKKQKQVLEPLGETMAVDGQE